VELAGDGFAAQPDKARYESIVTQVDAALGAAGTALLDVSLSTREYSPTVQMYRQIASGAWRDAGKGAMPCAFATVNGKAATTVDELGPMLQACTGAAEDAGLHDFDHVFSAGALKDGAPTVVLYGRIGSPQFHAFHTELSKLSKAGELAYVARHSDCGCSEEACADSSTFNVQGFGVELAIKSVEYKVKDDSSVGEATEEQQSAGEEEEEEDREVDGMMFGTLIKRRPELESELQTFKDFLLSSQSFEEPLKVWEMKDLGAQAAARVAGASNSLRMLREVSGNFPSLAKSLTKVGVNESFKFELESNTQVLQGMGYGGNVFAVAGKLISVDGINEAVDVFKMLGIAKENMRKVAGLTQVGVPEASAKAWLQPEDSDASSGGGGAEAGVRYDVCSDATTWLNDMETDDATVDWDPSLQALLEPSYQMQIYIRKNLFTAVVPLDPGSAEGLFTIATLADNLKQQMPIRLGLLILEGPIKARATQWDDWANTRLGKTDTAVDAGDGSGSLSPLIARAFHFIAKKRGNTKAVKWATELYEACEEAPMSGDMDMQMQMMMMMQGGGNMMRVRAPPTEALVKMTLRDFVERAKIKGTYKSDEAFEAFFTQLHVTDKFDKQFKDAADFTASLGVTSLPSLFVNGQLYSGGTQVIQQLPYTLREQYPELVNEVRTAQITDDDEVQEAYCKKPTTRSRILPTFEDNERWAKVWLPSLVKLVPHDDSRYVYGSVSPGLRINTLWAVVDLDSTGGLQLLAATLKRIHETTDSRAAVYVNSAVSPVSAQSSVIKRLLDCSGLEGQDLESLYTATETVIAAAITTKDASAATEETLFESLPAELKATVDACMKSKDVAEAPMRVREDVAFVSREMSVPPSKSALLLNGVWYVPKASAPLFAADIASLEASEKRAGRAKELLQVLAEWKEWQGTGSAGELSDKVAAVAALLPDSGNLFSLPSGLSTQYTLLEGGSSDALVHIEAMLNPLTTTANQLATIMHVLAEKLGDDLSYKVLLVPELESSNEGKLPLDKYYRFALSGDVGFEEDGERSLGKPAVFKQLPTTPVLTLGMHTLNSWMISPETSIYDLDNIVLADLGKASTLHAEYALRHLLAQGSCMSYANGTEAEPGYQMEGVASGLELLLGQNKHNPHVSDTLVMENLGYFQLRASPGIWYLHMGSPKYELSEGLAADVGGLSVKNFGTADHPISGNAVAVKDWSGVSEQLRVLRVGGMDEYEEMLAGGGGGFFGNMFDGLFKETKQAEAEAGGEVAVDAEAEYNPDKDPDCIHIFSLASGHAYERFQKIMFQSLLEHTNSKVKFWLLDNFASPQFKDFVPVMAKEFGFHYEFVSYNWPHWLRRQTQKQRVMWGYKILFLDVLFPLDVKRVIFVDADQILRADVKELWDMDLGEAPYGYTPMCTSNKNMEGFMFWNQGFWVEHLQGRPYHISALYVVDLQRFRATRVGDRLRGIYDQLSRDPNSLANLDQDLPNYAQHQIPIFSLPQEWLWCETWCSMESKPDAKTIDMCNNPQTKTPKVNTQTDLNSRC
jgi:UDP-glucose:glycoprotein glucosyltransferase